MSRPRTGTQVQLSSTDIKALKQAFNFFDKDGNGEVDTEEIGEVMKKLGLDLTKEDLKDLMNDVDTNGDDVMDFDEFIALTNRRLSITSQREELKDAFNVFDKNKDGVIEFKELKEVLLSLGEQVTDKDIKNLIKEADKNGDGVIDFEEFVLMMTADQDSKTQNKLLKL